MEQNTALLVMDMQTAILSNLSDSSIVKSNVAKAIANARSKKIPVIYVIVGFRSGAPEASVKQREMYGKIDMDEFLKIDPSVAPLAGEIIVTKRRVSAFSGSDLEIVLRAQGIQHIVLTGVATGGVVLSTVREASDKDYNITVLDDCCADRDEEVHRVLTTKIFPRQVEVLTQGKWSEK
ncbi:isochorismatase family protein [Chitinophaga oryziterrae]|uniref:Isochorismatase family protein n=1 Tax=Chitinophaga oryziterrae TaxID=1031224 RepID=A0A6N8JKT6_9BACT|nr:isochorismatase family cysteine hydrolase [Chitinophaga oryziterrae]MVT45019.1 isochorismatase family protein [Chitinophaga oryziterrae]